MTDTADELRAAATKLRKLVADLPATGWGDRPWHAEECSDTDNFESCACIVAQGEYREFDQPQDPPIQYVADAETVEHANYIATMHPGVSSMLADWLDSAAVDAEQIGADFRAIAVARQILGADKQVGRAA
ncbi:hypothetical protein [Streptomyces olivaceiscleroticus]|uniref:Uncharacterized protein n=1 Tax=Streptomyces olivaceiscleroticus TaxID=68245 RepID=A0ABP3LMV4_9ACTN